MGFWGYISTLLVNRNQSTFPGYTQTQERVEPLSEWEHAFNEALCRHNDCAKFEAAEALMRNKHFATGIEAYNILAEEYPEHRSYCELQIANAYRGLGKFNKAIEYLIAARVHGADEDQIDETVWQVCSRHQQRCLRRTRQHTSVEQYLTLFPQGKYATEAKHLIQD